MLLTYSVYFAIYNLYLPSISIKSVLPCFFCNRNPPQRSGPLQAEDHYKTEGICQKIARSNWFENLTLSIIAVSWH